MLLEMQPRRSCRSSACGRHAALALANHERFELSRSHGAFIAPAVPLLQRVNSQRSLRDVAPNVAPTLLETIRELGFSHLTL